MVRNHVKTAWRNILRQKVFSLVNISGLALSLTAVWLIALFVADELSYDRYHEKSNRIYRIVSHGRWGEEGFDITGTSALTAAAVKKDFPEVEDAVRIDAEGGGLFEYENKIIKDDAVFFADASFFNIFSYHFLAGNASALQKPNSIVLTKSLAAKLFADPYNALNRTISIDKSPTIVAGVIEDVPANSHFKFNAIRSLPSDYKGDWGNLSIYTYILLKKNASINHLRSKLPAFVTRYLTANAQNINFRLELQPLASIHLHSHLSYELGENREAKYVYVLMLVGSLILIIALINYINITTARTSVRLREVALRKIIGSDRIDLIGLFLAESLVVILIAGVISGLLAHFVIPLFNLMTGKHLSLWRFGATVTISGMLIFTVLAGLIGGLYPALFLSRFKPIPALRNELGNVKGQTFFRTSLVMFQFAVTVVMITCSLVIYLQINFVRNSDLGFNKKQLITFHLDSREVRQKTEAIRTDLLTSPLVKAVASAGNPIGNNNIGMMDYSIEKNGVFDKYTNLAYALSIDANFIPAMQIKMAEGRNFSDDIPSDRQNVIVNEAFVRRHGWASAMGKRISRGADSSGKVNLAQIIGVVKDYHIYSLQHAIEPTVMSMPRDAGERDNLYVRLDDHHTAESIAYVQQIFRKFDGSSPFDYHFLEQSFSAQYQAEEKQGQVLLAFTSLTMCIACLGLFGLITFSIGQREKEIGIRKVLGARVSSVLSLLTMNLLRIVLISMFVAIPISWLLASKWLENFAYRIHIRWWMFAAAGGIAFVITICTLSFQSIKAALANPIKNLRAE